MITTKLYIVFKFALASQFAANIRPIGLIISNKITTNNTYFKICIIHGAIYCIKIAHI